ncbi:MAG: OFA family MFS transporter [Clostridia bacterium]
MDFTVGKKRWIIIIASVCIQLCLGTTYIWSMFQTGIANALFNGNNALASLSFSFMIATLSVGGIISGILRKYIAPRFIVMAGGLTMALGFILASFVTPKAPWLLWITFGLMGGIGMGMAYSTTIATAQKWFPDKRGLATGIIISALGMGGVVFTPVASALMKALNDGSAGSGELKTFFVLGFVFLAVCTAGGYFIIEPPKDYLPQGWTPKPNPSITTGSLSPKEILSTPQYYIMTVSFLLATMGGLMMIGFAKPIADAKGMGAAAAVGVVVISVFNAVGRLVWGWVSDKLGRKNTIIILLCINAGLSLLVTIASGYWIFVIIAAIGFLYGGFLSNYASLSADYFGQKYTAFNYGLVMIGFGAGGVISSYIAGHFKNLAADDIGKMFPAFLIAAIAAIAGVVLIAFLKPIASKTAAVDEIVPKENEVD